MMDKPKYFEVVKFVDEFLPPKEEFDYTTISPIDLVRKFDEAIDKWGYVFSEDVLEKIRETIRWYQERNYNKTSMFLGATNGREEGFDQSNYSIQNSLSQIKCTIITSLANVDVLIDDKGYFNPEFLGEVENLKPLMTREEIEKYVKSVLTVTWEKEDTIRPEKLALVGDILFHFGIKPTSHGIRINESKVDKYITDKIDRLEFESRVLHGPVDNEGNYDKATTNKEKYDKILASVIADITSYVYDFLRNSLLKVEQSLGMNEIQVTVKPSVMTDDYPAISDGEEISGTDVTDPPFTPSVDTILPTIPTPATSEGEETTLTEAEKAMKTYELLAKYSAENLELARQLEEMKKTIVEIEEKIAKNKEEMSKLL